MKKLFFCLSIILIFSSLISAQFKELYHQNYDYVERVVIVFQDNPQYIIQEESNNIKVVIHNTIASKIPPKEAVNNKVLKDIIFMKDNDNLIIDLAINKNDIKPYRVKSFQLSGENQKVVLDIFRYKSPSEPSIYESYGEFYDAVGFSGKKTEFLGKADSLRIALSQKKEENISQSENNDLVNDIAESNDKKNTVENKLDEQKKPPKQPINQMKRNVSFIDYVKTVKPVYWIIFFAVILLFVLTLIIYANPEKSRTREKAKPSYRSTEGFGNEDYRINMISTMKKSGWGEAEIAKELMITISEVRTLSKKIKEQDKE